MTQLAARLLPLADRYPVERFLRVDPRLDPLRGEARFHEPLRRMAFP